MSLLGAALWIVGTITFNLATPRLTPAVGGVLDPRPTDWISAVSIATSLGLYFFAKNTRRDPRFVLDLGLVYLMLSALAIGLVIHWEPLPPGPPLVSWIGAIVLMFAAIVPNAPSKVLAAGIVSASMHPLGLYVAVWRGILPELDLLGAMTRHYPDYLMAGVAAIISRVMMRLGQQISKAREMGSYELISQIGSGGMGEVWHARHRMLARDAAVKLIHPEFLSYEPSTSGDGGGGGGGGNPAHPNQKAAVVLRRFEQEARATAQLRSPHTVELYDFGVTDDGVLYYAMELLDGIDLETLVRKFGPQPPARVAAILRQACLSLAEAHRIGMVHRDIKPSNILLCHMGTEYDFVKILDFGLVKVTGTGANGLHREINLTGQGTTTGTPAYMAPETALNEPVDGRTDLYSLGCVAYWLVTGHLVFEAKGATAMLLAHVRNEPVPPSQRCELPVPHWLENAILMCLSKSPADRPARAEALSRMLDEDYSWTQREAENWWQTHIPAGTLETPWPSTTAAPLPTTHEMN
jgi:eukaryotic-like serine/threonine-protein kinase